MAAAAQAFEEKTRSRIGGKAEKLNRLLRDVRLIPIVLFATISLLVLKVSGLVFDGGYTLAQRMQGQYQTGFEDRSSRRVCRSSRKCSRHIADRQGKLDASGRKQPWAQEMFNFNSRADVTGSVGADDKPSEPALRVSDKPPESPSSKLAGAAIPLEPGLLRPRASGRSLSGCRPGDKNSIRATES